MHFYEYTPYTSIYNNKKQTNSNVLWLCDIFYAVRWFYFIVSLTEILQSNTCDVFKKNGIADSFFAGFWIPMKENIFKSTTEKW